MYFTSLAPACRGHHEMARQSALGRTILLVRRWPRGRHGRRQRLLPIAERRWEFDGGRVAICFQEAYLRRSFAISGERVDIGRRRLCLDSRLVFCCADLVVDRIPISRFRVTTWMNTAQTHQLQRQDQITVDSHHRTPVRSSSRAFPHPPTFAATRSSRPTLSESRLARLFPAIRQR